MSYQIPTTADERRNELHKNIETYLNEHKEFKEKEKKSAGARAKKALTLVKKLIVSVRRDIQEEITALKKK